MRDTSSKIVGYPTIYDDGALAPVMYEGMRHRTAPTPQTADIFISIVPLLSEPLYTLTEAELQHVNLQLARELKSGRDTDLRRTSLRWAKEKMCAQFSNYTLLNLSALTDSNRARHFVIVLDSAAMGFVDGPQHCRDLDGAMPGEFSLPVAWDRIILPSESDLRVQMPCISSIRWSTALDALGILPPWKASLLHPERRTVLMSVIGSKSGVVHIWHARVTLFIRA